MAGRRVLGAVVLGGLLSAPGATASEFPIKTFPSAEKSVRAAEGQAWTMHGPGALARRRVVSFTVFVDGRARRVQEWVGHDPSCTGAIDTGAVLVTVSACDVSARVRVVSLDGAHTVRAFWEWHPRLRARRPQRRSAVREASGLPQAANGPQERSPEGSGPSDALPEEDARFPDVPEDTPDDQVPVQEFDEAAWNEGGQDDGE